LESADAELSASVLETIKRNLMVPSDLCKDPDALQRRLIKQREYHSSEQDEISGPHTRLDPVAAWSDRAGAAAFAWDTSADRGFGHFVSAVRLGAAGACQSAAMASGRFGKDSPALVAGPDAIYPAFSGSNG
jgi:hypothetical protein